MQPMHPPAESKIGLELQLFRVSMRIDELTREIRDHRQRFLPSPGPSTAAGAMRHWRRRSFELHRLRSEMKSRRDRIVSTLSSIQRRRES